MPITESSTETFHQLTIPCPLYDRRASRCQRSSAEMPIRRPLCLTDEHDACPLYLAYLLRHSRMMRCDNDWLDAS
ncbi:hypothetical protein [Pelovirga terrestris]|uniref:Uncharacterized protein n=1 Tax=Pelovirga terrestris TaxID=2771352 RepID=A0A8J6QXD4_9BACT|nr:hypothetical protein [Pelovirga terrestris]MBD1400182.1 hypothetical protein [Pelovirga terrestris]